MRDLGVTGAEATLWWLLIVLIIGSILGLFYYLRIIVTMMQPSESGRPGYSTPPPGLLGGMALVLLTVVLIWLGIYPAPLIELIRTAASALS